MNFIFFLFIGSSAALHLNKCCPNDKSYSMEYGIVTCEPIDGFESYPEHFWLPETFDKTLFDNLSINYNAAPCNQNEFMLSQNFALRRNENSILLDDYSKNLTLSEKSFCFEKTNADGDDYVLVFECPCNEDLCWFKCCPDGKQLYKSNKTDSLTCIESNDTDWNIKSIAGKNTKKYVTMSKIIDCSSTKSLSIYYDEIEADEDGSIFIDGIVVPRSEYCGDHLQIGDGPINSVVVACLDRNIFESESYFYGFVCLFGAVCHFVIAFLYFWLPEIGGSPKWALAIQTTCLLVAYLSTAYGRLIPMLLGENFCVFSGFLRQFSFLASFFWLNVMCIDIAWTFSGIQGSTGVQNKKENKKFIWYSIYSWGGSLLLSLVTVIAEFSSILPSKSYYKPKILSGKCWFRDDESLWMYFYMPVSFLLLFNLILFTYTTIKIIKLKRETSMLRQDSNETNNKKKTKTFILYLKIFLVMGVSWSTEIISWMFNYKNDLRFLWYITDTINILRMIYMFKITCCTHKVWTALKIRASWIAKMEQSFMGECFARKMKQKTDSGTTTTSGNKSKSDGETTNVQMQSVTNSMHDD